MFEIGEFVHSIIIPQLGGVVTSTIDENTFMVQVTTVSGIYHLSADIKYWEKVKAND